MSDRDYVTIVSGLPRSGTSMMMRMLEAGGIPPMTDKERVADDDNPRGYYEYEPVKKLKADKSWVKDAQGKALKAIHLHLADLPTDLSYKILFMTRTMGEILASQTKMLERSGKKGANLPEAALAKVFDGQVVKAKQFVESQASFELMDVSYNDLLGDAGPLVDAIDAFLGGGLDKDAMRAVVEPELYRQRK